MIAVDQSLIGIAQDILLHHPHVKDAKEIPETYFYVGLPVSGISSVVKLLKWRKGDKPKQGQFTFTNNGTDTFKLAVDNTVRGALEGMAAPPRRAGVDTLDIYEEKRQR